MPRLSSLTLAGWKSIRNARIDIQSLNVLIGANGAGKSNLLSFFQLLAHFRNGLVLDAIAKAGSAESLLYYGSKVTDRVVADFDFLEDAPQLHLQLILTLDGHLVPLARESGVIYTIEELHQRLMLTRVFHFHDTGVSGPMRRECDLHANRFLQSAGGNLAAMLYLYRQRYPVAYNRIRAAVRAIAPYFDDFLLEPLRLDPTRINLRWRAVGREYEFGPHQLSDGTLRAIALFTLLLGTEEDRPELIVLDEPELGLHPAAITVFADLVKEASRHCQIILATQSTSLVDCFDPQDVIAVNTRNGESTFDRLDPVRLKNWLEEYSIGELWEQNVIGGGPY